jgi:hypothetical protein
VTADPVSMGRHRSQAGVAGFDKIHFGVAILFLHV